MSDQSQREQALDPHQSFIVQAPAGSGKTELLTQRYLVLLFHAQKTPEEVLAITFTKKAASEMRARIMRALELASSAPEPDTEHARKTWRLAKAVLSKNEQLNWDLLNNPNRLRIQTIDSFCYYLTKQMPVTSRMGTIDTVAENADELYIRAIENFFRTLDEKEVWTPSLMNVMLHLNNDINKIKRLFIEMLRKRDQWLSYFQDIYHAGFDLQLFKTHALTIRKRLEKSLYFLASNALAVLDTMLSHEIQSELKILYRYAAENLQEEKTIFNDDLHEKIVYWQRIVKLLLTTEFEWRKQIDKRLGFPAESSGISSAEKQLFKEMKSRLMALINTLTEDQSLKIQLENIAKLPNPFYSEKQWETIETMLHVLHGLVAQLHLVFFETGKVDFIHITASAKTALEQFDSPTDLALRLDNQIKHILIDEFQDTSLIQYQLIESLITGWEPRDGRTLFLVGDPMQSIYRFRQADVGLFIKVCQSGLGNVQPIPLKLKVNFRSTPEIVTAINQHFSTIFPHNENISLGAISYHPCESHHPAHPDSQLYPFFMENHDDMIKQLLETIAFHQTSAPDETIAILVRKRSDIQKILPILKENGIYYTAVDIEQMAECQTVLDLLSLTRALLHPADRIAWFALLRSPMCGLILHDLHVLGKMKGKPLLEILEYYSSNAALSADGRTRLSCFLPIIQNAIANQGRNTLRRWVENTWRALGGLNYLQPNEYEEAQHYFLLLEETEEKYDSFDVQRFEKILQEQYVNPPCAEKSAIQIMTIHKSKGLEFDTVILYGLDKPPKNVISSLLGWTETEKAGLMVAPIARSPDEADPIYAYIKKQNRYREEQETRRLLYVAATRAKKFLYFFGYSPRDLDTHQIKPPKAGSFLEILHHANPISVIISDAPFAEITANQPPKKYKNPIISRLPIDFMRQNVARFSPLPPVYNAPFIFNISTGSMAQSIGTLVHRYLKHIAEQGRAIWSDSRIQQQETSIKTSLLMMGVRKSDLPNATSLVIKALRKILDDHRGQWVLNHNHEDAHCEYPLSSLDEKQKTTNIIVDRTFIENGTRWIIDYKLAGAHEEITDEFISKQVEMYRNQLETYAKIFKLKEPLPVRLGLYFPLTGHWREWEA